MSVMQQYVAEQPAGVVPVERKREYSEDERHEGLLALAACAGSSRRAVAILAERGVEIPEGTLRAWRSRMEDEYERLREEIAPKLEQELVRLARETAIYAAEVERKAIDQAEARLDSGKDIDPAKTAVAMSRIKATAIDRLFTLTGRPQTIIEHRRAEEMIRSLASLGVIEIAPEDVQEIPDGRAIGSPLDAPAGDQ